MERISFRVVSLVSIGIAVGAMGLAAILVLVSGREHVDRLVDEKADHLTAVFERQVATYLQAPIRSLSALESILARGILSITDRKPLLAFQRDESRIHPEIIGMVAGNELGGFFGYNVIAGKGEAFLVADESTGYHLHAYEARPDGDTGARIVDAGAYDPRKRGWYKRAREAGKTVWSPLFLQKDTGVPIIALLEPIYDENGLAGVINSTVTLPALSDFIAGMDLGIRGVGYIVDRDGLLVATSTREDLTYLDGTGRKHLHASRAGDRRVRDSYARVAERNGEKHHRSVSIGDVEFHIHVIPMTDEFGLNWRAVLVLDKSTLGAPVGAASRRSTVIAAGLAVASVLLAGLAIFAVGAEIARQKREAERLKASEIRLSHLLSASPAAVYTCRIGGDWGATYISDNVTRISGHTPEEFTGDSAFWASNIHPDDAERVLAEMGGFVERGHHLHEYRFRHKDGHYLWMHDELALITDEKGDPVEVIGNWLDITDRREARHQLRLAKEQAERANDAKSQFLAAASHDLRQPLHAMQLFAVTLTAKLRAGQGGMRAELELVDKLRGSIDSLAGLLNSLLDVSKLEAGLVEPVLTEFQVDALLDKTVANQAPDAQAKGIAVRKVGTSAIVSSDEVLLGRILSNLFSNAIRYTETGRILIGARRRGECLRIEVWDTGVGIPESETETIFEEFHQVDNPARQSGHGLGLGLAITKRACVLLGHEVSVSSTPGKGSVFAIEVPVVGRARARPGENRAAPVAVQDTGSALVLVIDDDPAVLDATAALLEASDYAVVSVASSGEALAYCRSGNPDPDVVVADFRLPGERDGVDTIEAIRAGCLSDVPGIIITGDTGTVSLAKIARSGYRVLHKPIPPDRLLAALEQALAQA